MFLLLAQLACQSSPPALDVAVIARRSGGDTVIVSVMNGDSTIVEGRHRLKGLTVKPGRMVDLNENLNVARIHLVEVPAEISHINLEGELIVDSAAGERSGPLPKEVMIWKSRSAEQ